MKPVAYMAAGCALTAWAAVLVASRQWAADLAAPVWAGMIGPLLAATVTWVVVTRAHAADPARVTPVMLKAFLVKVLFFGAYVVAMIALVKVEPVPFVLSFTGYFLALYLVEALLFAKLFSGRMRGAR